MSVSLAWVLEVRVHGRERKWHKKQAASDKSFDWFGIISLPLPSFIRPICCVCLTNLWIIYILQECSSKQDNNVALKFTSSQR